MQQSNQYSKEELIQCGHGNLFGPDSPKLPIPPMLMFDRITKIRHDQGSKNQGLMLAELDIHPDLWFFKCHFSGDPVMPGCLGLDALWQMAGFYLAWAGCPGQGRALGCGNVKFSGQVTPKAKKVTYKIDILRTFQKKTKLIIANGEVTCDGKTIYTADNLKVGLFHADDLAKL